jgi:hypothetical protein
LRKDDASSESRVACPYIQLEGRSMPDPLADPSHLSLNINDHADMWVGTVAVGYTER